MTVSKNIFGLFFFQNKFSVKTQMLQELGFISFTNALDSSTQISLPPRQISNFNTLFISVYRHVHYG